jgi:hypothetical protein
VAEYLVTTAVDALRILRNSVVNFFVRFVPMNSTRRPLRVSAALASMAVGLALVLAPSGGADAAAKTKLVCKTVKGKKKCTRVKVKSTKAAAGTDAAKDTVPAAAKDTVAPVAADTTIKK